MSERDELAKTIFIADNHMVEDPEADWVAANEYWKHAEYAYVIADGVMAAGYRKGSA